MAVAATTFNAEEEPSHESGGDANLAPKIAVCGGDAAVEYKKGAWSKEEDEKLKRAVEEYGVKNWVTIEKYSGLARPAKNCRLRWLNYLRPNLKKYPFTEEEMKLILDLHSKYGNSWSRIASKLAGRSDNEIKNFWHKRAKKCQRENLPIYPTTTITTTKEEKQQSHTNVPPNNNCTNNVEPKSNVNYFPNFDNFPTNYPPNHTLPQFQPSTLNLVNNPHLPTQDHASIHSLQTPISTPQPLFLLSSPSTLVTSHEQQQSPTNHFSDQTTLLLPNTPTYPTQKSQSAEIRDTAARPQASSLCRGGAASDVFVPLREPPILSSPPRRFLGATNPMPGSTHLVANASSAFVPPDSNEQIQWSSAMESSRSPLKLNLSPGINPVQMSTQATDSPVAAALLSGFRLTTPTTPPLSSPKLRLSISESCLQSNSSIPDSTVELNSSTSVVPLSSPQLTPSSCCFELPPTTLDNDHAIPLDPSVESHPPATPGASSCMHEVERSSLEIMDELRKAQARVRFLKKKLKQRNKTSLLQKSSRSELLFSESPQTTDLTRTEAPRSMIQDCASSYTSSRTINSLGGNSRVNAPPKNLRKKDVLKRILRRKGDMIGISEPEGLQIKKARREDRLSMQGSINSGENSESKIPTEKSLLREEDSMDELFRRKNLQIFKEEAHSIDLVDHHLNSQNNVDAPNSDLWDGNCSSMQGFLSESSALLQDSFLKGDLFGQRFRVEGQCSSQRQAPFMDERGRLSYLQSDEGGYFGCSFGRESPDDLERRFSEQGLMDGNPAAKPVSDLLLHQNSVADLLDSSYLASEPILEHESLQTSGYGNSSKLCQSAFLERQSPAASVINSRFLVGFEYECPIGEQYSLQASAGGLYEGGVETECTSREETWKHEPPRVHSLMEGLLAENLWPEGNTVLQEFSINGFESVINSNEPKNWNDESRSGHAGEVLQQGQNQDHMNTMSEELSSLLEFFPTNMQTLEWCNIGNEIPDTKASHEFEFDMGLSVQTSQALPPITMADYI